MPKKKESRSENDRDREPFLTIDDLVSRAEDLFVGLRKLSQIKYPLHIRRGIRKEVEEPMNDGKPSKQIKASGRTYFMDIELTKSGTPYLRITESRKGAGDKFERNSVNVFPEDKDAFVQAASEMAEKLGQHERS